MANETNSNTTTAPASTGEAAQSTGVETQVSNQADTTQQSTSEDAGFTSEVAVESQQQKNEEAQAAANAAAEKLNVNEMIVKQLRGEQFSDADKAKLEKAGLSVDQITTLAEAHKQVQLKNNAEIYETVGGQEAYEGLKAFAAENLSEEEAEVINQAFRTGNMKIAKLAVLGLKAMAEQANGKPAARRIDGSGSSTGVEGAYETQQDLINDLNNRKYGRDAEFTAKVDARRAKSGF